MLRWAWKTILQRGAGAWASAAGVASAFVLVIVFEAVFAGESTQIVAYIRHTDPDVWVMQRGVSNMHMASSFVWDWKADRVAEVEGVVRVTPILYLNSVLRAGGRNWFGYVVGLESGQTRGGPWAMVAGTGTPSTGEVIVPRTLAALAGIDLGGEVLLADKRLEVVGLSQGTFSMGNPVSFVHVSDLQDLLNAFGTYSYLLVDAQPGTDPTDLAARIEAAVDKIHAMPQAEFIESDFQIAMQMGVEIIGVMSVISTTLAMLIVAFTAYATVVRKRRELAIAKALGVTNYGVYQAVGLQVTFITGTGYVMALAVAWLVLPHVSVVAPMVTLVVAGEALVRVGVIALATALLGALVPAWVVGRMDPASAFGT